MMGFRIGWGSCDLCGGRLEGERASLRAAEMADLAVRGFAPEWIREPLVAAAPPCPKAPLFSRITWIDTARSRRRWGMCGRCTSSVNEFRRSPPAESSEQSSAASNERDWLRGIIDDVERSGLRPIPLPTIEQPEKADALAQQIATAFAKANNDPSRLAPFAGLSGTLDENYWFAMARLLLGAHPTSVSNLDFLRLRQHAANELGKWDDPRALGFLLPGLDLAPLVLSISGTVRERNDRRALPQVLRTLAALLSLRDRTLRAWVDAGFKSRVPHRALSSAAGRVRSSSLPPVELLAVQFADSSVSWLVHLLSAIGGEWGRRTVEEIYSFSLFEGDILTCASLMARFDAPELAEAVALAFAQQARDSMSFQFCDWLAYLVRHETAAGWWAMDRFCTRTRKWKKHIPEVREAMSKLSKPSDRDLRLLECQYGPLLRKTERLFRMPAGSDW
jgi:hypothetical protein